MKINRFQKNERRQELMIEEMEASISSFLTEIEDENSRLIDSLKKSEGNSSKQQVTAAKQQQGIQTVSEQQMKEKEPFNDTEQIVKEGLSQLAKKSGEEPASIVNKQSFNTPRAYVQNAYGTQTKELSKPKSEESPVIQTIEERVKEMYIRGMAVEEIAKQLNRGKTEIELMIKFHNKTR